MHISEIANSAQLSDDEYLPIWSAMMETARGRRFLSEFARRTRSAETRTLLDSVQKLEQALITARERLPDPAHAPAPDADLHQAEAAHAELELIHDVVQHAVPALVEASRINTRIIADLQDAADDLHLAASAIRQSLDTLAFDNLPRGALSPAAQEAHAACYNIEIRAADVSEIVAVQQISNEQIARATEHMAGLIETSRAPESQSHTEDLLAESMLAESMYEPSSLAKDDSGDRWEEPASESNEAARAYPSLAACGPQLATTSLDANLAQSPAVQRLIQEITSRLLEGRQKRATG